MREKETTTLRHHATAVVLVFLACLCIYGARATAQDGPPPSLNAQLGQAVARGDVTQVSALLTAGADPNKQLFRAAIWGQAEIFKLLMDHGARLVGPDNPGVRTLGLALYGSNKKVQEEDAKRQSARLAEGKAAIQNGGGYNEIIKMLLEHGVPADSPDELGITPLMVAAMYGNDVAVSLLLDHGAGVDAELKDDGTTALFHAAMFGHGKVVELLLGAGASPDKAVNNKVTPLLAAACAGNAEASALAMGGKAEGYGFVDHIRGTTYVEAVRALVKANADANLGNRDDVTPLMAGSAAGNLDIIAALLDAGSDPNLRDKKGRTALMFSAKAGQAPLVELLLSRGADPKAVALDGKTALSIAKAGKSPETVRLLQNALKR